MSSVGGVGSADGLGRLYAAATTGVEGAPPFLTAATVDAMAEEQVWGLDRASGLENAFAVVFMKPQPARNFGSHRAFGHEGGQRGARIRRSFLWTRVRVRPPAQ